MIKEYEEILKEYKIDYVKIEKDENYDVYNVTLSDDTCLTMKYVGEKEKIAWEYKYLLSLEGKMKTAKIYKAPNGEIIKEAVTVYKVPGKIVKTYEDKKEAALSLGSAFGMLHISELDLASSEEELKDFWKKFILGRTFDMMKKVVTMFNENVSKKISDYITENYSVIDEEYVLTLGLGRLTNHDYTVLDGRVVLLNFDRCIIGDPVYDFAHIYEYYYDDAAQINEFIDGYENYLGLPDNFEEKLPFYKVLVKLEKIMELAKDREKNDTECKKILEQIEDIIDGKFIPLKRDIEE